MQALPEDVRTPDDAPDEPDLERRVTRPDGTHEVTIEETDDGNTEITVPISSTTEHRSGGMMTELALESMREQLEEGTVGLWDDHGLDEYGWPEYRREDMYGWWVGGEIEEEDSATVLYGTARLREGDERSADLVDQLEQGMPIGFSVGYKPLKDEWVEREDGERREIIDLDLMETSPVGIPDNKDAYASAGMQIASALAETDINPGRAAETITANITDTLQQMSDGTDNTDEAGDDPGDGDEQHDGTGLEVRAYSEDEIAEIMEIVGTNLQTAIDESLENVQEELANADGGEGDEGESAEGGDDDDEDDEDDGDTAGVTVTDTAGTTDAGGDSDALEELRSTVNEIQSANEELRSENEELRAKVDRLESESRESEGRKGMTPVAGDDSPDETDDAPTTDQPRNALDEARRLAED